jgi:hypothetical protein
MSYAAETTDTQGKEGKSSDEGLVKALLGFGAIAASPITAGSAALVYYLFSYKKIKRKVILAFTSPLILGVLIFIKPAFDAFIMSWTETFPSMIDKTTPVWAGILYMLFQQMWLALPLGVLIGLAVSSYRWYTRMRWETVEWKKTPWEIHRYNRNIKLIKSDEETPLDGMTLGIDEDGNRVVQSTDEASAHTFITGGSGSGKSRTAMMRIRDQIKHGEALTVIDLKGDPEFTNLVRIYAERYGRKFQHFTLQDTTKPYTGPAPEGNAHYDPLSRGDHTRRADMVLDLREWDASADFFKKMSQSYLQLMFAVLINNPRPEVSTLEDAIDLMSPKYLQERARPLSGDPKFATVVRSIDALNDEKVSGNFSDNLKTNRSILEIFLQSIAGPWLILDKKNNNNISLLDSAYNGDVVFFSLDSQSYPTLAAQIADLIIQDLKTVSGELLNKPLEKPYNVFIDEFSAIGSDNIINLINKARASKMSVTIATQTLSDLDAKAKSRIVSMQLLGIVSSFIIHRANYKEDAEVYAGLTGTSMVNKVRTNITYEKGLLGGIGKGTGKGTGSVEEVEEENVKPTDIQSLDQGEFFYINSQFHKAVRVKCIIEDIADPTKGGTENALNEIATQPELIVSKPMTQVPHLELVKQPERKNTPNSEFVYDDEPQSFMPQEGTTMAKKHVPSAAELQAEGKYNPFDEAKNSKKVPLDYTLLRSFFNHKSDVDEQEQEDIADGVVPDPYAVQPAAPAPEQPQATAQTAKPVFPPTRPKVPTQVPQKPAGGLPTRPSFPTRLPPKAPASTKKDEFDF